MALARATVLLFIEKSANIPVAVKRIMDSKTFDNGTICASEQSIITERCIEQKVVDEVSRQGGYFMTPEESEKLSKFIKRRLINEDCWKECRHGTDGGHPYSCPYKSTGFKTENRG